MLSPERVLPHFYQSIPGYFSFPDFYSQLAREKPHGHGVEVGSFMGRSAAYLAVEIANRHGLGRLDLVDTFTAGACADEVRRLLRPVDRLGLIGELHACLSWEGAARYGDATLDYVYIDADHHYEPVCRDIDAWLPKVKPGGVIAGHDFCEYPGFGVIQAVTERFSRFDVWRGIRFDGDGVRTFENTEGLGRYYPTWCAWVL